ncbi:MAG: hypothetical protein AAB089_07430 [Nitrospirota bacterium]
MLDRIRKSFNDGVQNIKWFATFIAERTKVETSMARLLYESKKLETEIDALYSEIGKRVLELKEKGEKEVLKDFVVVQAVSEIKKIREQIEDYNNKAHALSKPSDLPAQTEGNVKSCMKKEDKT